MEYRKGIHTVYDIKHHLVLVTKYRFKVLAGDVVERTRDLIRQSFESHGIVIVKGNVTKDHLHLLVSVPPSLSPSKVV